MKKNKGENNIINNIIKILIILIGIIIQIAYFSFLLKATTKLKEYGTITFEIIKFISIIYIVYKRQNPSYKIIWIILLMFMPVTGFVVYMLWGNNKTPKTIKKRIKEEQKQSKNSLPTDKTIYENIEDDNRRKEAKYIYNVSKYPTYNSNEITYFESGEKCFKEILEDLKNAKEYILIEFFIISKSKMWEEIYEILKQKTKEKIKIYLIYDSLGSLLKKPRHFNEQLKKLNIEYIKFNPPTPLIRSFINYRDHRKIIVIDGKIAYTGGINIGDEYINVNSKLGYWKDSCARIKGEAIKSFIEMFFKQWNLCSKTRIDYGKYIEKIEQNHSNKGYIIPYADTPHNKKNPAQNTYINIINNAKKYIYIMTPYLILDNETNQALINASLTGIDVKIITPSIPDKKLVNACTKSFYGQLLESGIKIYEYKPGFIHSKIILSDDTVATIGTTNFDFRSFYLNYECGIWIHNTNEELKIKQDFINTIQESNEIKLEKWKKRKLNKKIQEAILRLISPLL
jgi:cardiolipin synthase